MKQILLSFRIFDNQVKKYLTPDSKVYIGLDGKLVTPEGPDTADRYELAYSLPIFDITGKQLFTDDGFVTIFGGEVVYARPVYDTETNSWVAMASKYGVFPLVDKAFQILPNAEEVSAGNIGSEIQAAWDKKLADMPQPQPQENAGPGGFSRSKDFKFGLLDVVLTLRSDIDMPDDVWEEHFKAVMECDDIFSIKKEQAAAEPEEGAEKKPVVYFATELGKLSSERAPIEWRKLPEISAAYPKQGGVEKSLQLVDGTTNVVAWEIGRNGHWSVASPFFLVQEKKEEEDESTNP
jgi:hypothetical protein